MTAISCALFWACMLLLVPVLFLAWLSESRRVQAQRLRRAGWSQQRIADHLGITRYRVRVMLNLN